MSSKPISPETFMDRIKKSENACWEWQGTRDRKGYGKITINKATWRAHRYAYLHFKGNMDGLSVLHKCDNPCCCNPDHLFLGNAVDNALDMIQKGRGGRVKLTIAQIFKIRELYASGMGRKQISEQLNVKRRTVDNVVNGKRWSHLTQATADQYQILNQTHQS